MEAEHPLVKERLKKIEEMRSKGMEPYPYKYEQTHHSSDLISDFESLEKNRTLVSVAGRVIALRPMGKVTFGHLVDAKARIQFYLSSGTTQDYDLFKLIDIGDIIGVKGTMFRTQRGEITVNVSSFQLLSKCIRPLPEKWHGLKDVEIRYRQRYLDFIMNPDIREVFLKRTAVITEMRSFLDKNGFIEVETPTLQPIYGGARARPFKTHHNALDIDLYLRISNELYLKRLIVAGFEKVYEFVKDFRNEGIDRTHNPEFTMMECYWAYADYNDMMKLTEEMLSRVAKRVTGKFIIEYQGKKINLKPPWKRLSMAEALREYANLDVGKMTDGELLAEVRRRNLELIGESRGYYIEALFEGLVEKNLLGPVFITDFPKETSPLSKLHRTNPELIERFEPYIAGWELGNAYSELNDPVQQRKLLEEQAALLRTGVEEAHPMDEDFVQALEYGMPPTAGLGIGVDRFVMLLTNSECIRDVILFPVMKPKE